MKVKFTLSIGFQSKHEEYVDYPDDTTDEEFNREWNNWAFNYIDGGFTKVDDDECS